MGCSFMSLAFLGMLIIPGCSSTGCFMTKGSLGLFNLNFLAKGMSSSSSQVSMILLLILIVASVSTSLTSVFLFEETFERRRFKSKVLEIGGLDSEGSEVEGSESEVDGLEIEGAGVGGSLFFGGSFTTGFDGFL